MVKKRYLLLAFILMLISNVTLIHALPNNRANTLNSTTNTLQIRLFDPSYGDYDEDGKEDDVKCYLEVIIASETVRKTFISDIYLILPNGDVYSYSILVSMITNSIILQIVFMNHAYVSGDYTIRAEINLFTQGYFFDYVEIVFDPPSEEVPDDDPFMTFTAF
ncbi:MAG: hypothetical protein JXA54_11555 [Candidatus Heimdallarchaeota archaeon]|nr:hypothetical protein [Candidatus Heimdallarchaeota archaeon]